MKAGRWAETAVLLVAAALLFARLGANELGNADEAVHAQVAREMVRDGHWLYPTCRGEPYFEKPPLKLWLTAATFGVAGESEFTARFWSALFGMGTVWSVMRFGRLIFNRGVGLAAGLVLATTWEFLFKHCARTGELDSGLLFFTALAITALWQLWATRRPRFLYAAAVWLALGILTKGHMVLIFLLWLPFVWWMKPAGSEISKKPGLRRHWFLAGFLFFGLVAPWFILQAVHYGPGYLNYLFRHQLTGYLLGKVGHANTTVGYYLEEVIRLDYPWPPIVVLGGLFCGVRGLTGDFHQIRAARAWLFAWIAAMVAVLALSRTKLPWYHLPIWIPMSILGGLVLERWWNLASSARAERWLRLWLALHVGFLFLVTGFWTCLRTWFAAWRQHDQLVLANFGYYFFIDPKQHSFLVAPVVLASVPIASVCRWALRKRPDSAIVAVRLQAALIVAIAIGGAWLEVLRFEEPEGVRETVQVILAEDRKSDTGGQLHLFDSRQERNPSYRIPPSLFYYLASEPRLHLQVHPADLRVWQSLLDRSGESFLAIVPVEWLDEAVARSRQLTSLLEINNTRLVRVGAFPGGSANRP